MAEALAEPAYSVQVRYHHRPVWLLNGWTSGLDTCDETVLGRFRDGGNVIVIRVKKLYVLEACNYTPQ